MIIINLLRRTILRDRSQVLIASFEAALGITVRSTAESAIATIGFQLLALLSASVWSAAHRKSRMATTDEQMFVLSLI